MAQQEPLPAANQNADCASLLRRFALYIRGAQEDIDRRPRLSFRPVAKVLDLDVEDVGQGLVIAKVVHQARDRIRVEVFINHI